MPAFNDDVHEIIETRNNPINIKNEMRAIDVRECTISTNPIAAEIIATTRNEKLHLNVIIQV